MIKITLDKTEIDKAVECYLTKQGLALDSFTLETRIAVSRTSEDTKIEVSLITNNDQEDVKIDEPKNVQPFGGAQDEISGD